MKCLVVDIGQYDYADTLDLQAQLVTLRQADRVPDVFLLVEHGHTYTVGRRANPSHLLWDESELKRRGIRFYPVDRGGEMTYHGPGQLIGYPIMKIGGIPGIRYYLHSLEEVMIRATADFGVRVERIPGHPGVWFGFDKLAAIGLRVTRGVTKHGFALNASTDLSYFKGIVPCGLHDKGVTSLSEILGHQVPAPDVKASIIKNFGMVFNVDLVNAKKDDLLQMARIAGIAI